jgi:hypothetical protein
MAYQRCVLKWHPAKSQHPFCELILKFLKVHKFQLLENAEIPEYNLDALMRLNQ